MQNEDICVGIIIQIKCEKCLAVHEACIAGVACSWLNSGAKYTMEQSTNTTMQVTWETKL